MVADCHALSGHDRSLWQRHFYGGLRSVVEKLVLPEGIDFGWARLILPGETRKSPVPTRRTAYCFGHDLNPALVRGVIAQGVPCVCLPYAFNPEHLPDCECREVERPAAFIGMPTGPRVDQLGQLREAGCEFADSRTGLGG